MGTNRNLNAMLGNPSPLRPFILEKKTHYFGAKNTQNIVNGKKDRIFSCQVNFIGANIQRSRKLK